MVECFIYYILFHLFIMRVSKYSKASCKKKKSHTCEEGGAHLRVSFWHLLMNFGKP